jgi:glutathione peroxidase-family protein
MKRGVLIQALGHSNYYQMAVVLAASIKTNDKLPICLITNKKVQEPHKKLFDIVKEPTQKSITQNGKTEYIKAKLFMYDYSPFDETIFLDADQIMINGKKLSPLFDELKEVGVSFSNTGVSNVSIWADLEEVKKEYGDKPFWNLHSEFIYFKKGKEVKKYFDVAKKIYEENKLQSAVRFANANMADELAFECAAMITDIYPHQENWLPNFWHDRNEAKEAYKYPYELVNYLTYSIGGKSTPLRIKTNYNILAKSYFAKLGLSNPYQVVDKQSYLPERKLI